MNLQNFRFEVDGDGIALLTWDMPGRSMNVITAQVMDELESVIDKAASDETIKGVVVASGKETFSGGADLSMLEAARRDYAQLAQTEGEQKAMQSFFIGVRRLSLLYRKLETSGKPWAAAINGLCVGGAFELTLACHYRVMADIDKARVGLPEIRVGLFPGAGGTQRVARLMPTPDALQMLLKGEQIGAKAAKARGLVHLLASPGEIVGKAKEWIRNGGKAVAPWDEPNFRLPSGRVHSPAGMMIWPAANAIYRRETYDNYPAARALLQNVYDGLQLPIDLALEVETRAFAHVLRTKEAGAMIRSLFISLGALNKGARRPAAGPSAPPKKIGIIGAGFMGASIAYVSARAGIDVVLIDRDQASADKGKAVSAKLIGDEIMKGRAKSADRDALLARISATPDYAELAPCELVIEAVFEDRQVKAEAIRKASAAIGDSAILASNTSTLPITSLAAYAARPEQFVGIHFFSPVERMMLVELIRGKATGDAAIAEAFDFVQALRKTPIVVEDSRGFFANRCVGNYLREGHLMLAEGVPPAMIETVARMAGMPVGPLSLTDEVAIDLVWKILQATKQDLGEGAVDPVQEHLLDRMVNTYGRLGRKNGKGFYDYPEKATKRLWPGLADLQAVKLDPDALDVQELKERLLVAQALEAARTVEEGVIGDPREADVGSILGFGFAPFTGGTLSYIDGMGSGRFALLCDRLAKKYGPRFEPSGLILDMGKTDESFYGRFGGEGKAA
jgi:3-hydroxyacyl-CoA dehydrogenase/enoyl-CoA hydratase/3-hydroxybutyryl-CoA epimerase